uniref:Large ribosomal subunit protein uL4 n=1 Tax=candidate division WOR-3 bacterium TaxID=2052148 RepID=A0A7C4GBG8_UNCW3
MDVIAVTGAVKGQVELPDVWFKRQGPSGVLWQAVRCRLANRRAGTACSKTRTEVSGTGKKPWRQKHTGRARHGSRRSPIWVGGGVVFGPRPRDYGYELPKREKRLALAQALSARYAEGRVKVIEDFELSQPKTKELLKLLEGFGISGSTLLLVDSVSNQLRLASRNVSWLDVMPARLCGAYDVLAHKSVVFTEKGLATFLAAGGEA